MSIKNKIEKLYAEKELILSGGSIYSPQLLMLSGVGGAQQLKEKGINVVHDLKGVGKNLQDHLVYFSMFNSSYKGTLDRAEDFPVVINIKI